MNRTQLIAGCMVTLLIASGPLVAQEKAAEDKPPEGQKLKLIGTGYEAPRMMPAMRVVVRDEATLYAVGPPRGHLIDFTKEMALFACLGPGRPKDRVRIAGVTATADKLVPEVLETTVGGPGRRIGAARTMVIIPRSDLPVEGFTTTVPLGEGLIAASSPVLINGQVDLAALEAKAQAAGYKAESRKPGAASKRVGYINAFVFHGGPAEQPRSISYHLMGVTTGRSIMCQVARPRRLADLASQAKYPPHRETILAAVQSAYSVDQAKATPLVERLLGKDGKGPRRGLVMFRKLTKGKLDVVSFRKHIGSDGKRFTQVAGMFGQTIDELGDKGMIRWLKPCMIATQEVEGKGKVTLAVSELGTFQVRWEPTLSTDRSALQAEAAKLAETMGLKLDAEGLKRMMFAYQLPGPPQRGDQPPEGPRRR